MDKKQNKKQDPTACCIQETHFSFSFKEMDRLKVQGWKKIYQANGRQKKAGIAILTSDKADFYQRLYKAVKKVII